VYPKRQKTNKLFFNKFTSKVGVSTPTAFLFRGKQLQKIESSLVAALFEIDITKSDKVALKLGLYSNLYNRYAHKWQVEAALNLVHLLQNLSPNDFTFRVESTMLGIYFNDDSYVDKIINIPDILITDISQPETSSIKEKLLSEPAIIIKDKVDGFNFKISIHGLFDDAIPFLQWTDKMSSKIKTTGNSYQYGGYFYVTDERVLNICRVYLGDKIKKIEKIIASSEA
jgi:hypothetical protein